MASSDAPVPSTQAELSISMLTPRLTGREVGHKTYGLLL